MSRVSAFASFKLIVTVGFFCVGTSYSNAQGVSTVCKFTAGLAVDTACDYASLGSLPIGSACQDGQGSTGVIVAESALMDDD